MYEDIEERVEVAMTDIREAWAKVYETEWYKKMAAYKNYFCDKIGEYKYRWNNYMDELKQQLNEYPELKEFYGNIKLYFDQVSFIPVRSKQTQTQPHRVDGPSTTMMAGPGKE